MFHFNVRHQPLVSNQRQKYSPNTTLFGHGCFQASCRACQGKHQQDLTRTLVLGLGTVPKLQLLQLSKNDHFVLVFSLQMGRKCTGSDIGVGRGCKQKENVLVVNVLTRQDFSDWHQLLNGIWLSVFRLHVIYRFFACSPKQTGFLHFLTGLRSRGF